VEARGERKGRVYQLSAALYRRLGTPADAIRLRGFDALQQEQLVLQYIRTHGRITRREAAELCRVSGPQATYLLGRMAARGHLVRRGERKGVYYELASQI